MRTKIRRISSIFLIVLLTGIFCPLLGAAPKDNSNENRVAAESSNNAVGMNWPSSLGSLGTSSMGDTSFPIISTFTTVMTNTTSWDTVAIATPYVLFDSQAELYKMWYWAMSNPVYLPPYYVYRHVIAYAESSDGVTWTNKTVVQDTGSGTYHITGAPYVLKENGAYLMWHMGWYEWVGADWSKYIALMSSSDGVNWPAFQSSGDQKVLSAQGQSNPQGDGRSVSEPWVIYTLDQGYTMWYSVYDYPATGTVGPQKIWTTMSPDGVSWTDRQLSLPYVPGSWEANVAHPSVVKEDDGTYTMYYAAAFANGSSSIGVAQSLDGTSWTNRTQLLKPSDLGANITSISDPSYFQDVDGNSYLYFTYYDGQTKFGRVQLSNTLQLGRTYGGPGDNCFLSMIQTMDGGFALAGYTNSFGAGGYDFWLVKTDSSGNMQWNQTYGGPGDDEACCVVQTSDGGYALAGYTDSFGAGGYVFWLVKTDGVGNMQWNQTYGGPGDCWTECVIRTSDGGYAMAGYGYDGGFYCLLVKTDEFGHVVWIQTYEGLGVSLLFSVVQTTDGGYAMAGLTYSSLNLHDFLLVKTDASGNLQWSNTYGGPGNDVAYSLIQTSDGYALIGYTDSYGLGGTDFYLAKTDSSGNIQWNQTYGGSGDEQANSIYQTLEGGYLIGGYTSSFGAGGYDFWVATTDFYGNMYERKTFGGPGNEFCYGGVQTKDRGYTVCGCTDSYGAGNEEGVTYSVPFPKYTYDKGKLAKTVYGTKSEIDLECLDQHKAPFYEEEVDEEDPLIQAYQNNWCAPTAAADCLAWFAEVNPQKYGKLIPNFNPNNKQSDWNKKKDKYMVAKDIGRNDMNTGPNGTKRVDLLIGLLKYISACDLGSTLVVKPIYDPSYDQLLAEFKKGEDVIMTIRDGTSGHTVVLRGLSDKTNKDGEYPIEFMDPADGSIRRTVVRPRMMYGTKRMTLPYIHLPGGWPQGAGLPAIVPFMISVSPRKEGDPPGDQLPFAQSSAASVETLNGYVVVSDGITYVITGTDFGEVYVVDGQVFGVTGGTVYNTTGTVYGFANGTVEIDDGTYFPVTGSAYIINGSETENNPYIPSHDVAVVDIELFKTVVGAGYSMSTNVTVDNGGNQNETFLVTACANATLAQSQAVTLASGDFTTITFTWNSTGFTKGKLHHSRLCLACSRRNRHIRQQLQLLLYCSYRCSRRRIWHNSRSLRRNRQHEGHRLPGERVQH